MATLHSLAFYFHLTRYTIREESTKDGMLSTISIKRTQREDSALFTCVATNAFGSDDTSINLIVQEKPETPYGLRLLDKTGRTVKLSWQAPYNGNSNLTRYVIQFKPTKVRGRFKFLKCKDKSTLFIFT